MSPKPYPKRRCRYIGAYLIIECYRDINIPIISVTATAINNTSAVAAVRVHPNPFLHKLTRGTNIFVVCEIVEQPIDTHPKKHVMFIGDVSSIQTSANAGNVEYIINLVDNRRYIAELPSFYLKLMRTQYETFKHTYTSESKETVFSYQDQFADANFYGIAGKYLEDTFYYHITDPLEILSFMQAFYSDSLYSYIAKMLQPLQDSTGWEPYYVNMNKKKRITSHITVYDDGIFRSDIAANFAETALYGAIHSIKNAHAELNTTYEDALGRLSELGYLFNTNLFPAMSGGMATEIKIPSGAEEKEIIYTIKSTLFHGDLLGIVKISDDADEEIGIPTKAARYFSSGSTYNMGIIAQESVEIYDVKSGNNTYYAIVSRRQHSDMSLAPPSKPRIKEFTVMPKFYGVVPPRCNWGMISESMTFNCIIAEPPITALKYNLIEGNSGASVFSCAYPGNLKIFSYQNKDNAGNGAYSISLNGVRKANISSGEILSLGAGQRITSTTWAHSNRSKPSNQGGTDIGMKAGTRIGSYTDGIVVHTYSASKAGDQKANGGKGNEVVIESVGPAGTFKWHYWHLDKVMVNVNTAIVAGQLIGTCGSTGHSTGPHLHLGIKTPDGKWVNTYRLFDPSAPAVIKAHGKVVNTIVTYDLAQITTTKWTPGGGRQEITAPEAAAVGPQPAPDWRNLYPDNYYNRPAENIYGLKRVSTRGSALYEMEKMSQYLEGGDTDDGVIPAMTADHKSAMLRAKVIQDYYESTVSRNTGTITIEGLNEYVMVGFPYLLYAPKQGIFYYGFVEEVSHKIDNSAGHAYTEISLSSLTTAYSINEIEQKFAGYMKSKWVGEGGFNNLNGIYGHITSKFIRIEEYRLLDLYSAYEPAIDSPYLPAADYRYQQLLTLLGNGMNYRPICPLEKLQNYMYGNKQDVALHDNVAGSKNSPAQWITSAMWETINQILNYYDSRLKTSLSRDLQGQEPVILPEDYTPVYDDNYSEEPELIPITAETVSGNDEPELTGDPDSIVWFPEFEQ